MVTISIMMNLLGVRPYLSRSGIDYNSLMVFCLIWGMGGSFISLAMSRFSAKMMMGVKVISPENPGAHAELLNMVTQLARAAGLPKTPEVGIYESGEVNAFATGPTKSRALVAFSSGLLRTMSRSEIEGVAAHEIAHVANGDMVTMTLIQGVVNAFVMFFARVIAFAVSRSVREESEALVRFLVTITLDILLGILGSMVVAWFSRQREFRADAGGAQYAGRGDMIGALTALQRLHGRAEVEGEAQHASLAAFKISSVPKGGFMALFRTHPPLEERIARLNMAA